MTESSGAPTTVIRIIDDTSGTTMDATFERAGAAVRLRSVAYGHTIELPNPLPRFPYNLAASEAEKALRG